MTPAGEEERGSGASYVRLRLPGNGVIRTFDEATGDTVIGMRRDQAVEAHRQLEVVLGIQEG